MIDLAARTAVVDGARIELPPAEFRLLTTLAEGPGKVFPTEELVRRVWPDDPVMNADDLRWRIWHLRKRIGDGDHGQKLIGNRRGVGYFVDLPPEVVQVIQGPMSEAADAAEIIDSPAPENSNDSDAEAGVRTTILANEEPDSTEASVPRASPIGWGRSLGRPTEVILAVAIVSFLLSASWAGGYWLSQRGSPSVTGTPSRPGETTREHGADKSPKRTQARKGGTEGRKGARGSRPRDRSAGGVSFASRPSTQIGASSESPPSRSRSSESSPDAGGSNRNSDWDAKEPPPPAPQPNASLYHLFNPESGDHFMTTSSSAAGQKQAEGYNVSTEGRVFSQRVDGTTSVSIDSGSAFVYRDAGHAPAEVNVSPLYSLFKDGDFFHTVSSSLANQAQAQGWTRSTSGYVAT